MAEKPKQLASRAITGDIKAQPRLASLKNDELTKAITAKLLEGPLVRPFNRHGNYQTPQPSGDYAWNVTEKTSNNIQDNRNLMQLLPDVEMAKQILINSILAPNDMLSSELTFGSEAELLGELQGPMLAVVENYFKGIFDIESQMPVHLEHILFKSGSYPVAVIPESAIDDAINSPERVTNATLESLRGLYDTTGHFKTLGLLGSLTKEQAKDNPYRVSIESISKYKFDAVENTKVGDNQLLLSVTDNPHVLKQPMLLDKIRTDRIRDRLAISGLSLEAQEDASKLTDAQLRTSLFKTRQFVNTPVLQLKPQSLLTKDTVGHPLVMTLPAESIIPVHTPGNPDDHVAYFVLLDQSGNPLSKATISDYFTDLAANINHNKDLVSQMLNITRRSVEGRKPNVNEFLDIESATQLYMDVVEQDLMQRLRNGVYGDNVKIARPQEVYRIMLARACARMYTQLLFVPAQCMCYMAFDYNQYGVGKSLLEDSKIIGSIRAMTLFANSMASIKNSVGHVELDIELDPNDPDPGHTIEMLMHEYVKTRQAAYPIGASNPLDIVNYLQAAAVEMTAQGHPGWPTTKLNVNDKTTNRPKVDTEFEDSLRKRHLLSLGVSPEHVDLSMGADFATSVIQNNLLLAKRALITGKKYTRHLSDLIRKITINSQPLMDQLRDIINQKKDIVTKIDPSNKYGVDGLVTYFISTVRVSLPEPNLKGVALQMEAFDEYNKALDAVLPAFVSEEIYGTDIMGDLGNSVRTTVAVIKAHLQRKWLRENNVLPEVFDLIMADDPDKEMVANLLEIHEEHMKSIGKSLMGFLKKALKAKEARDKQLQEMGGVEANTAGGGGGGEEAGGEGGEGGGAEDEGFDFGEPPALPGEGEAEAGAEGGEAGGETPSEETPKEEGAAEEKPEAGAKEETKPEEKK